jgi:hypothetical protein
VEYIALRRFVCAYLDPHVDEPAGLLGVVGFWLDGFAGWHGYHLITRQGFGKVPKNLPVADSSVARYCGGVGV